LLCCLFGTVGVFEDKLRLLIGTLNPSDDQYPGLLLTMSKFFIWISSSKSSNIILLFFSQIMGMYFMSMVVLMRMNMPVSSSKMSVIIYFIRLTFISPQGSIFLSKNDIFPPPLLKIFFPPLATHRFSTFFMAFLP
jgi:hypothetical protein